MSRSWQRPDRWLKDPGGELVNLLGDVYGYYSERPRSRTQYINQARLAGINPVYAADVRTRDSMAKMDDIMRRDGFTFADVKYASLTPAFGAVSSQSSATYNFVSKNIYRLYK